MSGGAGGHTPEPWRFVPWHIEEGPSAVRAPAGWAICFTSRDADATRIVACVNALAGIPTQQLEGLMDEVREVLAEALITELALMKLGHVPDTQLAHKCRALLSKLGKQP